MQLLFNNAGYIQICFFADADLQRQMNNLTVNATIAVQLTHHYINKMTAKNLKGQYYFPLPLIYIFEYLRAHD